MVCPILRTDEERILKKVLNMKMRKTTKEEEQGEDGNS
jgi:hypothetical protein